MRQLLVTATVLVVMSVAPAGATTIRVPADQPTIQAGIQAASFGDTVLVAGGVYYEHDIVMEPGVWVCGATGNPADVVVDAQDLGRVFLCVGVEGPVGLSGLTITGGNVTAAGGGLRCEDSSPVLRDLVFIGNRSTTGAGLYCIGDSFPQLDSVRFESNDAWNGFGGGMGCFNGAWATVSDCQFLSNSAGQQGGGIHTQHASATISNSVIAWNSAERGGGLCSLYAGWISMTDVVVEGNAADLNGGGFKIEGANSSLERVSFVSNEAGRGGGMYCWEVPSLSLEACVLDGNIASYQGAGMYMGYSSPQISGSTFSGNTSANEGGGLWCGYFSSLLISDTTLHGNSAVGRGGGILSYAGSVPTLQRTIVAFSAGGGGIDAFDGNAIPMLSCCDVYGNAGGDFPGAMPDPTGINGNISSDPMFCDPDNGNFMLDQMSPCAPDNNSCGVLIGAYPVSCGASPVEATSWGRVKAMYR